MTNNDTDGRLCAACLRPMNKPSPCDRPHAGGAGGWRPHPRVRPSGCTCAEGAQILVWHWCDADGCDGHPRCVTCGTSEACS